MTLLGSLFALWFTIKYFETGAIKNVLFSSLSLFLGLLSKENSITFLAVIPLSMYYFYSHKNIRQALIAYVPLFFAAGIFLLIRASILGVGGEKEIAHEIMNNPFIDPLSKEPISFGMRMATIFVTLWMYVRLLVFPHPLTYDYYPYQIPLSDWSNPYALMALVIYLGIGLYAIYGLFKRKDMFSYAIWMFLIPLSVVSNIFFSIGTFMNERFIFISSIGFVLVLAWIIYHYLPKLIKNESKLRTAMLFVLVPVLLMYSGKTMSRNRAWENDFVLFTTDVKVSYNSAKSTCSAGGKLIEEAQKPEIKSDTALHNDYVRQAINYLERSLEIHPQYVDALNLMGNAWYELEMNTAKSLENYTEVLRLRPYHNIAYNNSSIVINNAFALLNNGESINSVDEILDACLELNKVKPGIKGLNHLLGTLYGRYLNNVDTAIIYLNKEIELGYETAALQKDLGVAYGIKQMFPEALAHFERAITLDPNDYTSYMNAGYTCMNLNDVAKGEQYLAKAKQMQVQNQ
jgi:tetratricopeptide (TPR) repeat protein